MSAAKATPSSAPPIDGLRSTVATVKVIMLKATPESNVFTARMAIPASATPATSPARASSSDSARKERRIEPRPKPSARSVPISAVRLATAAYMVFSAPNVAPAPMMVASVRTRM